MSTSFLIILGVNLLLSFRGFRDSVFFEKNMFHVDSILIRKEYKRLVTSAFLHANTTHLLFNMLSFYFFVGVVEREVGELGMLIIYVASLLAGNLLSLFIQRNNGNYRAIGASGAVSGIVFAAIALYPSMKLYLFFMLEMPAYLYAILYVAYSINGIRKQNDQIGHEAHLGGAIAGVLIALLFVPKAFAENTVTISLILVPIAVFIAILLFAPKLLMVGMDYERNREYITRDDEYNIQRKRNEDRLNYILEKIARSGVDSLSDDEKDFLDGFSSKS